MDSNIGIGKNVDRISQLPDPLLCHILSFLSTKFAVGTSVLSTRWRNLWASVPNLVLDEFQRFRSDSVCNMFPIWLQDETRLQDETNTFTDFVDRVLLVNDAPTLQKCSLSLESNQAFNKLETWISAALARNVQELKLSHFESDGIVAPNVLFTSETLVVLELHFAAIRCLSSVWLPRLKVLILERAEYDSAESMQKLFSGCPVLEELYIKRCMCNDGALQDLNVSVPTLRRLKVGCGDRLDNEYDTDELDYYKLVIDAPQLEHLDLTDFVSEKFLFNNLLALSKASIMVGPNVAMPTGSSDLGRISQILSQLSNVKSLDANLLTELNYCKLPTFHNLTQLKLGGNRNESWNLKLLGNFLKCSPNLEVLTLEGGRPRSWKRPKDVPICLSLRLKSVEILHFTGEDYELNMIRYFLEKGEVLKKMTIHCKCSNGYFYTSLAGFPRGSKKCELSLRL